MRVEEIAIAWHALSPMEYNGFGRINRFPDGRTGGKALADQNGNREHAEPFKVPATHYAAQSGGERRLRKQHRLGK
jgi:hypothetical protein